MVKNGGRFMKDCSRSICATDWFGAKTDIVGRLIGMAKIRATHNPSSGNDDHADYFKYFLSY